MTTNALPHGYQLATATIDDVDKMLAIEQAAQITPWTRQSFADSFTSGAQCQLIRNTNQQVVAFQVLSFVLDESHLMDIAVLPTEQGKGLGRYLVEYGLQLAAQQQAIVMLLEVRASNQAAQALYQKLGFVHYHTRKDYYRTANGFEDAWLMQCLISPP